MTEVFLSNILPVAGLMIALWLWSVIKKDASVVDPWWSIGFLVITLNTGHRLGWTPGRACLAVLVAVWALRLWGYLMWRNWGKPEDSRYQAFREKYGPERYWWISLFQVFGLQGALMLIISAPLQAAMSKPVPDPVTLWDLLGAALVIAGVITEALADSQMAAFKARPDSKGQVMDRGLWRYSRHPNYFGEAVVWWGFWLCSLDCPQGLYTVFAPTLMTFLLLRVSGVTMLEPELKKRRPAYADYIERTSAFIPWPPRASMG